MPHILEVVDESAEFHHEQVNRELDRQKNQKEIELLMQDSTLRLSRSSDISNRFTQELRNNSFGQNKARFTQCMLLFARTN